MEEQVAGDAVIVGLWVPPFNEYEGTLGEKFMIRNIVHTLILLSGFLEAFLFREQGICG